VRFEMINAVIRGRGVDSIIELPQTSLGLRVQLISAGIREQAHKINLFSTDDDSIQVQLYADNEIGNHLVRIFSEQDTLADVNMAAYLISNADIETQERIEENILNDQYSSIDELLDDIREDMSTEQRGGMIIE